MPAANNPWRDDDLEAIARLNSLRARGEATEGSELAELEERFTQRFGADRHLAVYGTLAPGRSNHDQLSALEGDWTLGLHVRGTISHTGWGAAYGHPALAWSSRGERVEAQLFVSPDLPRHWRRLDDFEGSDYLRILVPVYRDDEVMAVANLYADASSIART